MAEYRIDLYGGLTSSAFKLFLLAEAEMEDRQIKMRLVSVFLVSLFGGVEAYSQTHLARRLITISVEVNSIAGVFLIDTGANCTIIDSAFARRLGLKPSGTASLERNYSTEQAATVTADSVRFGEKVWSAVPLVTLDLSILSRIHTDPISGVLGTDLLATMVVKLSYSSGTAEVIPHVSDRTSLVPLKEVRNRYFVPVKIGPSTFDMLLDSGTNMTALSNSAWRTLPASWKPHGLVEGVQSSGSPPGSLMACVPELRMGGTDIVLRDHPPRVIMPSQSGSFVDTAFAGILGGDVFEHYQVYFDLKHSSMYLKPDPGFRPDPYEFVTIGIQFLKPNADEFSVVPVWKHSPAEEAGVVVGDRILSVNGHSSADLELDTFANQLHGAAGTPIAIELERAAEKFTLQMKTRQLVCGST